MSPAPLPKPNLDFTSLAWSDQERTEVLQWFSRSHGHGDTSLVPFVPWMIEHAPAAFKRYRAIGPTFDRGIPHGVFALHLYPIIGFRAGIQYETTMARHTGWNRQQVIEVLNFSGYLGGPNSQNAVAEAVGAYLDGWVDDDGPGRPMPENWKVDPDLFRSGIRIDDSTDLTPGELDSLRSWHERMFGEVPRYVGAWAELSPAFSKVNRSRFEVLCGETLPAQLYPLLLAHASAWLERPAGLLQALRWARTLGVTRQQAVTTLELCYIWGGEWKMAGTLTDEVLDLFDAWV